jgi:hypothetical protein
MTERDLGISAVIVIVWYASLIFFLFMCIHFAIDVARGEEEHVHGGDIPDWYDAKCCGNRDCKPVPAGTVENKEDGLHVKGHGVLSYTDPRLNWSRDQRDHICESNTYYNGVKQPGKLLCVYRRFMGG